MFSYTSMEKIHVANYMQDHLNKTVIYLQEWRITINPKNIVAKLFGDKTLAYMQELKANEQVVDWTSSVILGITLESKFNFNNHVTETYNKARKIGAALYLMLNRLNSSLNQSQKMYS